MSTNATNGSKAAPSREQMMREATYRAAVAGYYDTSEAAQRQGLLTISVMDMAPHQPLPAGASYQFYIMVNHTGWVVAYYPPDRYEVVPHDQTEQDRAERELRESVLDTALWYLTTGDYHTGSGPEARAAAIKELLEDDEQEEREEADPVPHAVIREVVPDVLDHGILRLWFVQIGGDWNTCEVGLIRYNPDGSPEFITMEPEGNDEEDDEDE
jgi:hypothetical protein